MDADGGNRTKLTQGPESDADPSWSPDGTQIVYGSFQAGSSEVTIIASDGSGPPANLTDHAAYDSQPAWSPDGTKIAFYSDRDGGDGDIYLMDPNGANVQRLTTDMSSYTPDWQSLPPSIHGDIRCDGAVDATDGLGILREVAGMAQIAQTEPCPDLGDNVGGRIFGDVLCNGGIDSVDALAILRFVAGLPPLQAGIGCPAVGDEA
jgi:hypothetical protein